MADIAVPGNPHLFQLKLWDQVKFFPFIRDKIHKGVIRFKVNRDAITLAGAYLFGIMPESQGPNEPVGSSINRVHLELYDESDNSMVASSYGVYALNSIDTDQFMASFEEFAHLKPNQIYRLEVEFSGPKRRYGNVIGPDHLEMYCGRAGTVAVDIVERKRKGSRLVQGLVFQAADRKQLKPTIMEEPRPSLETIFEASKLEKREHLVNNKCTHELYLGSEVFLFSDVGFYDQPIEKKMSKGLIRFRVNKRIELNGMSFFGMLSIDEEMTGRVERQTYDYKVESICVKECDGACDAMITERWLFHVPADEKVPLQFIRLTLLGPSEWYTMEFDIEMPAFRFGKTLASTQEVDCGPQGTVVFEFDLEKTVNAEAISSIRFTVSEDQTVGP